MECARNITSDTGVREPGGTGCAQKPFQRVAGQPAVVPRGVVHWPSNTSDGPVRFLFLNSPPMDEFFVQLSAAVATAGGRLPAEKLRELGDRHDSIFVSLPASGPVSMHNEDA